MANGEWEPTSLCFDSLFAVRCSLFPIFYSLDSARNTSRMARAP